jgi:hypothetical protein
VAELQTVQRIRTEPTGVPYDHFGALSLVRLYATACMGGKGFKYLVGWLSVSLGFPESAVSLYFIVFTS